MIIQGVALNGVTVEDASITTSNMLLYLDAANPASYPGSGATWYDLSGNNNNTTGTAGTTYNSANGGYFDFNGSGYFTTASAKYNTPYTGKSIFIAAKLSSAMVNSTYRCLFGNSGGSRNFNLYMYRNSGGNYQLHFDNGGSGGISNVISYTAGNWFTAGITVTSGGVLTYYFNGQTVNSGSITFYQYFSTTTENVGASDNYWLGPIATVCIYKAALTSNQMLQNHNAVRTRYGL